MASSNIPSGNAKYPVIVITCTNAIIIVTCLTITVLLRAGGWAIAGNQCFVFGCGSLLVRSFVSKKNETFKVHVDLE